MPNAEGGISTSDGPAKEEIISIWAKAVDTQMHFNEMSVKSRQLGLTFVAAALGIAVVLISQGRDFSMNFGWNGITFQIHVAVLLIIAALLAVLAVKQLDLGVYHRMLRGAVTFGEDLENSHLKQILGLEKGMTQAISHFSRHTDARVEADASHRYAYHGSNKISAETKIRGFYSLVIWFLAISAVSLFALTNIETTLKNDSTKEIEMPDGSSPSSN